MGVIQQSLGSSFEELFQTKCNYTRGIAITRFPTGCRVIGKGELVKVKTPWDWVISYGSGTALIDTKTTEGDSFPHSKIEKHQVEEMYAHAIASPNTKTGYVIWFRKSDDIYFASSLLLNNLLNVRGSIKGNSLNYLGKSSTFKPEIIFGIHI